MRYANVIWNDIVAGDGLCVSFYTQGCPHRCPGCHNPETWDFEGGQEFPASLLDDLIKGLHAQGIDRPLCILGGEPLCPENIFLTTLIVRTVRDKSPNTPIYVWTGYLYEDLQKGGASPHLDYVLNNIDYLIDGPYDATKRNVALGMRGSENQRVFKFDRK